MTVALRSLALLGLLSLTAACSPRLIAGTPFPDTKDTRAILEIVAKYKRAYEARDAQAIAELSSVEYFDRRDQISHETLVKSLQTAFDRVKDVHLDIKVNRVNVEGDKAWVDYFYSTSFQLANNDENWKQASDDKRMILRRENGVWRVRSGF